MGKRLAILAALVAIGTGVVAYVVTKDRVTSFSSGGTEVKILGIGNSNIHLVRQGESWILIDSGFPGDGQTIVGRMRREGVSIEDVDTLIVTHGHHDHAGNARYFQREYGLTVVGGAGDLTLFSGGTNGPLCPTSWFAKQVLKVVDGSYEPFKPDLVVDSEFDLQAIGMDGTILPQYSHTSGTLIVRLGTFLFAGDQIRGGILFRGRPQTHFFMCDLEANRRDLDC